MSFRTYVSSVRSTHYAEISRQTKTTCSHHHQEDKQYSKRAGTSYVQSNNPKMACDTAIGQRSYYKSRIPQNKYRR